MVIQINCEKNPIISIIREARIDEKRALLSPNQIQTLINKFPNLQIFVQPSKKRCFKVDDRISRATTASHGKFCPKYGYLREFIK